MHTSGGDRLWNQPFSHMSYLLTLDQSYNVPSCSTHQPLPTNVVHIRKTFFVETYVRADTETDFTRLLRAVDNSMICRKWTQKSYPEQFPRWMPYGLRHSWSLLWDKHLLVADGNQSFGRAAGSSESFSEAGLLPDVIHASSHRAVISSKHRHTHLNTCRTNDAWHIGLHSACSLG